MVEVGARCMEPPAPLQLAEECWEDEVRAREKDIQVESWDSQVRQREM